jgi:hypothetical protein
VFETNKAVSLAKAVFERKDDDQEEARKKYERDILSRPSVFSKVTDRIKSFDKPEEAPINEPLRESPKPIIKQESFRESPAKETAPKEEPREPVVEAPVKVEKVVPLCSGDEANIANEQPKAAVSRASGKFGVTLRRTGSRLSDVTAPKEEQLEAKPEAVATEKVTEKAVEEITDVRQLEIMVS